MLCEASMKWAEKVGKHSLCKTFSFVIFDDETLHFKCKQTCEIVHASCLNVI